MPLPRGGGAGAGVEGGEAGGAGVGVDAGGAAAGQVGLHHLQVRVMTPDSVFGSSGRNALKSSSEIEDPIS